MFHKAEYQDVAGTIDDMACVSYLDHAVHALKMHLAAHQSYQSQNSGSGAVEMEI
jgi:hypothetical protein